MNLRGNFPKNSLFFVVSVAKLKNIVVFAFTYVWESFALFLGNFCMDEYSVDSDEAMKRGNEALNASLLQFLSIVKRFIASSLRFLLSVKRFIADNFLRKTSFNDSSPLLFKVTVPTSGYKCSVRLDRSMALYIHNKANNCKLTAILTHS
jgi:hypothetical protein